MSPHRPVLRPANKFQATGETALNTSWLLWGLLFGSVGLGFFIYGKRQKAFVPLICGLLLMIFPYFVSNTFLLVAIGIALMAVPYFVRI
jgi:predicted membrane protein